LEEKDNKSESKKNMLITHLFYKIIELYQRLGFSVEDLLPEMKSFIKGNKILETFEYSKN